MTTLDCPNCRRLIVCVESRPTKDFNSLFDLAVRKPSSLASIRELLAFMPPRTHERGIAVLDAVNQNRPDILQELLDGNCPILPFHKEDALTKAASGGCIECILTLLAHTSTPLSKESKSDAVSFAVYANRVDSLQALLRGGVSLSQQVLQGAINVAQKRGFTEMENFLTRIQNSV